MRKPCPYCGKSIASRLKTCRARKCSDEASAAWHRDRLLAREQRLRERAAQKLHRRQSFHLAHRLRIFERDGWTCHICTGPIDRSLKYPHPGSAVIDHLRPLAKGGTNEDSNLAAAHRKCNSNKGTRIAICVS